MATHNPGLVALIIITFAVLITSITLNYLSSVEGVSIYVSDTGTVSDNFYTTITPAGWTFTIWAFIFIYQCIWLVYGVSTIFRKNKKTGEYLYLSPVSSMPPLLYGIYLLNLAFQVAWIFIWDRSLVDWALLDIVFVSGTLYACVAISLVSTARNTKHLTESGHGLEIRLVRGMVHNGLGMYTTWVTIATLLNFAIVLTHKWGVAMETAGIVALSVLLVEIVAWVTVDFAVLDRYTRYLITPHIVIVVGLTGSLLGNWDPETTTFKLTATLLGLGITALVAKIIVMIARTVIDSGKVSDSQEELKK